MFAFVVSCACRATRHSCARASVRRQLQDVSAIAKGAASFYFCVFAWVRDVCVAEDWGTGLAFFDFRSKCAHHKTSAFRYEASTRRCSSAVHAAVADCVPLDLPVCLYHANRHERPFQGTLSICIESPSLAV